MAICYFRYLKGSSYAVTSPSNGRLLDFRRGEIVRVTHEDDIRLLRSISVLDECDSGGKPLISKNKTGSVTPEDRLRERFPNAKSVHADDAIRIPSTREKEAKEEIIKKEEEVKARVELDINRFNVDEAKAIIAGLDKKEELLICYEFESEGKNRKTIKGYIVERLGYDPADGDEQNAPEQLEDDEGEEDYEL